MYEISTIGSTTTIKIPGIIETESNRPVRFEIVKSEQLSEAERLYEEVVNHVIQRYLQHYPPEEALRMTLEDPSIISLQDSLIALESTDTTLTAVINTQNNN